MHMRKVTVSRMREICVDGIYFPNNLRNIAAHCNGRHRMFTDTPQSNGWHCFVLERSPFQTPAVAFVLLVYNFFKQLNTITLTLSITSLQIYVMS